MLRPPPAHGREHASYLSGMEPEVKIPTCGPGREPGDEGANRSVSAHSSAPVLCPSPEAPPCASPPPSGSSTTRRSPHECLPMAHIHAGGARSRRVALPFDCPLVPRVSLGTHVPRRLCLPNRRAPRSLDPVEALRHFNDSHSRLGQESSRGGPKECERPTPSGRGSVQGQCVPRREPGGRGRKARRSATSLRMRPRGSTPNRLPIQSGA